MTKHATLHELKCAAIAKAVFEECCTSLEMNTLVIHITQRLTPADWVKVVRAITSLDKEHKAAIHKKEAAAKKKPGKKKEKAQLEFLDKVKAEFSK